MTGFGRSTREGVTLWSGRPDCQAAHDTILSWLREHGRGNFYTDKNTVVGIAKILKGNIGEFVACRLANGHGFSKFRAFTANAHNPLNSISKTDIDIVWIRIAEHPRDDCAVLQEVKTTGRADLGLADELVDDYEKLFGSDPNFRLNIRLQAIKGQCKFITREAGVASRITALAGQSPRTCARIQLLPTIMHEARGADPVAKMVAVRSALIGRGWSADTVGAWAIALSDLNDRLIRLAMGDD